MEEAGGKSCFRCKRSTRYICSKHILQPPKYLIIIVNHLRYVSNQFIKKSKLLLTTLNFVWWSLYCFCLLLRENILLQWRQNYPMWYKSYPRLLHHIFIHCLFGKFITRTQRMGIVTPMVPAYFVNLIKYKWNDMSRNLLGGHCVFFWWPLVWLWYLTNCVVMYNLLLKV